MQAQIKLRLAGHCHFVLMDVLDYAAGEPRGSATGKRTDEDCN